MHGEFSERNGLVMMDVFAALLAFAAVGLFSPGPNNLMLMASGMNYGVRRTVPHMAGVAYGFPIMLALVGIGLVEVFERYPTIEIILKVACGLYLCWLAWRIASAAPADPDDAKGTSAGGRPFTFFEAAAFQWVNPKAWALALTALTVYALPLAAPWNVAAACLTFAFLGSLSAASWTVLGQQIRRFLKSPRTVRIFNVTCALLLVASLWPMLASFG